MDTTQYRSSTNKPHALAIPLPFQGHINPLMEFSKKLISAGFMVTFANIEANHHKAQSSQHAKKKTENDTGDLHMVSLEEGFRVDQLESALTLLAASLSPAMMASIERLLSRLQTEQPPVTLLVCDFRLHFVHTLAKRIGIPSVSFWTQNAANFACNLFLAQGLRPPPDDSTSITCVRGVPPFKRSEISGLAAASFPPPLMPSDEYVWLPFRDIHKPTWVVLNTFKELEATTLETVRDRLGFRPLALGPLVNTPSFSVSKGITATDMDFEILQWLHNRPSASVLYVAFGTIFFLSEEQLEELVLGFEESGHCILWVFRPDLCNNSKKYTIEYLSRRLKNQGSMVVPWAPQWHVLRHPSVGGFLTHCGWNSTLEGITAGVPMLAWPGFIDQFLTRRCLEHQWGIGMGFQGEEGRDGMACLGVESDGNGGGELVGRIEVQRKVMELMQGKRGKEMRERAGAIGEQARRALEEGGSSHGDFSVFLQGYRSFRNGGQ